MSRAKIFRFRIQVGLPTFRIRSVRLGTEINILYPDRWEFQSNRWSFCDFCLNFKGLFRKLKIYIKLCLRNLNMLFVLKNSLYGLQITMDKVYFGRLYWFRNIFLRVPLHYEKPKSNALRVVVANVLKCRTSVPANTC